MYELRDTLRFPSFAQLPNEFEVDPKYYDEEADPKFEWCLLAEITESVTFGRLHLTLKDRHGETFALSFYTEDSGKRVDVKDMQPGMTVAIMSPIMHVFLSGEKGIRQEEYDSIRFFKFPLDEIYSANDHLHEACVAISMEYKKRCMSCLKERESNTFFVCGRCGLFYYCDKKCQFDSWWNKGHKRNCKVLKDSVVRALLDVADMVA